MTFGYVTALDLASPPPGLSSTIRMIGATGFRLEFRLQEEQQHEEWQSERGQFTRL